MPIDKTELDNIWLKNETRLKLERDMHVLTDSLALLRKAQIEHRLTEASKEVKAYNEATLAQKTEEILAKEKEIHTHHEQLLVAIEKMAEKEKSNTDFQFSGVPEAIARAKAATDMELVKQRAAINAIVDKTSREYDILEKNYQDNLKIRKNFGDYLKDNILTDIEKLYETEQRVTARNKKFAVEPPLIIKPNVVQSNAAKPTQAVQPIQSNKVLQKNSPQPPATAASFFNKVWDSISNAVTNALEAARQFLAKPFPFTAVNVLNALFGPPITHKEEKEQFLGKTGETQKETAKIIARIRQLRTDFKAEDERFKDALEENRNAFSGRTQQIPKNTVSHLPSRVPDSQASDPDDHTAPSQNDQTAPNRSKPR